MATGSIILHLSAAELDDTSPPGIGFVNSRRMLLFDTGTDEICYWSFRLPSNYSSTPVLKLQYSMTQAIAGTLQFEAAVMANSPGDAVSIFVDSYDTVNSDSNTVPGTIHYPEEISITLTNNDAMIAGDFVWIKLNRDVGVGGDAEGDAELWNVTLEYLT